MTDRKKLRRDTIITHAGRDPQRYAGLVNTPVFRGSTVLFPNVAAYESRDPDDYKTMRYGIYGTPTTFALEAAVAQLEGGQLAPAGVGIAVVDEEAGLLDNAAALELAAAHALGDGRIEGVHGCTSRAKRL